MKQPSKKDKGGLLSYRPLDRTRREIRLVELRSKPAAASNGNETPLLRMHHAFLDSKNLLSYDALSYNWGTGPKRMVVIEDKKRPTRGVLVSANLVDALCQLASYSNTKNQGWKSYFKATEKSMLWIDQLCINQGDDEEKSHQVTMMMDIYKQARMTNVWLGSEGAPLSFEVLKKYELDLGPIDEARMHDPESLRDDSSAASQRIDQILSEMSENNWEQLHALTNFCTHPWFERAWVIQEVATSHRVIVHWEGPRFIPLIEILESMHVAGKTKATQPEDLIFSMIGIASDGDTCGIGVDYSKHYTKVFRDTVMQFLKTIGARALAWNGQFGREMDADGYRLPSWVTDFRLKRGFTIHRPHVARRDGHPKLFSATRNREFEYNIEEVRNVLFIRTHRVDRIVEVKFMQLTTEDRDSIASVPAQIKVRWTELKRFIDAAADRSSSRYDNSAWEDIYWRLPVTDRYRDGAHFKRAGLEVKSWYMDFIRSDNPSSASTAASKAASYGECVIMDRLVAFVTDTGYIGIGAPQTVIGDEVHLLQGSDTPFILRQTKGHYELGSETYVHGIMDGELVDDNTNFEWLEIH
ncbi:MAG: hypothetical protein Q9168_008026 [Polycauliona sp. 1 TL-2023]